MGRVMPIYKFEVLKPTTLANNGGQIMHLSVGDIGTIQAIDAPYPDPVYPVWLEAKFAGKPVIGSSAIGFLRFQPKSPVPENGDIRQMFTTGGFLKSVMNPMKPNSSRIDGEVPPDEDSDKVDEIKKGYANNVINMTAFGMLVGGSFSAFLLYNNKNISPQKILFNTALGAVIFIAGGYAIKKINEK